MSDLEGLVKGLASQLGKRVQDTAKREWEALPGEYKDQVEEVLKDAARLTYRSMGGENVDAELAHVKAAMLSWGFVGASRIREAIKAVFKEVAVFAGKVLLKLVV